MCALQKLCIHSRTGAEYELPHQYLSKESQPLYMGRKDVLVTQIKLRKINLCTNKLFYMNMLYMRKKRQRP